MYMSPFRQYPQQYMLKSDNIYVDVQGAPVMKRTGTAATTSNIDSVNNITNRLRAGTMIGTETTSRLFGVDGLLNTEVLISAPKLAAREAISLSIGRTASNSSLNRSSAIFSDAASKNLNVMRVLPPYIGEGTR
jgi:hypothetical protein